MKIMLHQQDSLILVNSDDILYCQSDNCYVTIHLYNKKQVVIVKSLKKFQQYLPNDFIRVSQSFIINPMFMEKIDKKKKLICLEGNNEVPFTLSLKELILLLGNEGDVYTQNLIKDSLNYIVKLALIPFILTFLFSSSSIAQNYFDKNSLTNNLKKAGKNNIELVKTLAYFKKKKDPLQYEAAGFLIANMDIHSSSSYYWTNESRQDIKFDEFSFVDFDQASKKMKEIQETQNISSVEITTPDLEYVKSDFLINNIEQSFRKWRASPYRNIPFKDFLEFILPYRTSMESIQDWRNRYSEQFKWISDSVKTVPFKTLISYVAAEYKHNFSFGSEPSLPNEPFHRLGALELLFRKTGACDDVSGLTVFELRSQGIPAACDIISFWGTTSGRHFTNTAFDVNMKPTFFDITRNEIFEALHREPAKVIRTTYSKQKNVLANIEKNENIPPGFLQRYNYIDVTNEYWETSNLTCPLSKDNRDKIVYASVFNSGDWQPTWWGKQVKDSVIFSNLAKGVVYLPCYYEKEMLIPAGYPKVLGFKNEVVLKPNAAQTRTVVVEEQEKYLKFRPGKKYDLYYWDNEWKLLESQTASETCKELKFENAPSSCLFRLIPEYSQGKERPFIILDDGKRIWL